MTRTNIASQLPLPGSERKPLLVALCSPAMSSGKSTVATHLVQEHGFVKLAFASPLKSMTWALLAATGMAPAEIERRVNGDRKEETIPVLQASSRRIQQLLGTEFGREMLYPEIWVEIAMSAARSWLNQGRNVVIDDMRFPNELAAVRANGGHAARIIRPGSAVPVAHASEGQLDGEPMTQLVNDSAISVLHTQADAWLFSLTESLYS